MAWRNVWKSKNAGGLGLRMARDMNHAHTIKSGWELCTRREALWMQIVHSKYHCGNSIRPHIYQNRSRSNLWKGICNNWV